MTPEHKYYPHTIEQKLGYLVEECGEVLAAVGKTQRWGLESYNPDKGPSSETNRDWILRELIDLESACAMVRKALAALPDTPQPSSVDNPDADATDCAHPAWWRGNDQGVWSTCELLTKTLDGVAGGVCREPLETVRRRIAALGFGVPAEIMEAAKALDNFAWSCVQCDNNEAQRYLSELRENLRAALARQQTSPPSAAARVPAEIEDGRREDFGYLAAKLREMSGTESILRTLLLNNLNTVIAALDVCARTHTAPVDPRVVELAERLNDAVLIECSDLKLFRDMAALIREMAGEKDNG